MRRKSSLVSGEHQEGNQSSNPDEEKRIEKEITEIDRHYDFDVPSAIDWDLLIVNLLC